uniref:acid phosphatase n=1 Tax=Caenorhabditis japonica TaxID=281687 RepID=A0A8R1DMR4_CAEJA
MRVPISVLFLVIISPVVWSQSKLLSVHVWDVSERALRRAAEKSVLLKGRAEANLPALVLEKEAGLAVPSWFNEDAYKEAKEVVYSALSVMSSVGDYYSPRGIRPKSGLLLHKILQDIKSRADCYQNNQANCGEKRFQVYSTHDLLILSLLESLGLRTSVLGENTAPEFMATLIIETWIMEGKPSVKVFYRKYPRDYAPQEVTSLVRNCPWDKDVCPVELFTSCCSEFTTSDAKAECYGTSPEISTHNWEMNPLAWIFVAVSVVLLLFSIILVYLVIRFKNRSKFTMKVDH